MITRSRSRFAAKSNNASNVTDEGEESVKVAERVISKEKNDDNTPKKRKGEKKETREGSSPKRSKKEVDEGRVPGPDVIDLPQSRAYSFCIKCGPVRVLNDGDSKCVHNEYVVKSCVARLACIASPFLWGTEGWGTEGHLSTLFCKSGDDLILLAIYNNSTSTTASAVGKAVRESLHDLQKKNGIISSEPFRISVIPLFEKRDIAKVEASIIKIQARLGSTVHTKYACFLSNLSKYDGNTDAVNKLGSSSILYEYIPKSTWASETMRSRMLTLDPILVDEEDDQADESNGKTEKNEKTENRKPQEQLQQQPHRALDAVSNHPDVTARNKVASMAEEYERMSWCASASSQKVLNWLECVSKLPMNKFSGEEALRTHTHTNTNTNMNTTLTARERLQRVRAELDADTHGMQSAKTAVEETAAALISAPRAPMRALVLEGPPGSGKTTFVTRAVGRALNRPVRVINVGGIKDSTMLLGHNYTYEGSKPGRIFEEVTASGVCDPVIVFDEVDKVSDTPSGKEIVHVLMALTDPVQNRRFSDNYLAGVPLDLSRVLIVFTCNDISAVDPVLVDRVRVVNVPVLTLEEKRVAATRYILPRIVTELGDDAFHVPLSSAPPPLLPENEDDDADPRTQKKEKEAARLIDKVIFFCDRKEQHRGMRAVEKTLERVVMNSNIRRIMEGGGQPDEEKRQKPIVTADDVKRTIEVITRERESAERSRNAASMGHGIAASMYI